MKWKGRRQSDNVEDRRGMSGGGKVIAGGGAIAIVFFLVKMFFPEAAPFVDTIQQSQGAQQTEQVEQRELTAEEKEMGEFVSTVFADTEDITREGIIGGYVHGNEPAHHVAYLYNWAGQPWKTQERVRMILKRQYKPTPDGLGGNDDCGQMSAWYVWSCLGMYPLNPVSGEYVFGVPLVNKATIRLEGKKQLSMTVIRHSGSAAKGIVSAKLNGRRIPVRSISHQQLQKGGRLVFTVNE